MPTPWGTTKARSFGASRSMASITNGRARVIAPPALPPDACAGVTYTLPDNEHAIASLLYAIDRQEICSGEHSSVSVRENHGH